MNDNRFCSEPMCMAYGVHVIGKKKYCSTHAREIRNKAIAAAHQMNDAEITDEMAMAISERMERDVRMV